MKTPSLFTNCIHSSLARSASVFISFLIGCFAISPKAQALSPAPDGGYPGANTAEGQNALLSLTTGTYNTAVGLFSLKSDTTGSFNTAIGAGTLVSNTANENTATGFGALFSNTTGTLNTANRAFALFSNTTGNFNTANGFEALFSNTTGADNTANGSQALYRNTTGSLNVANGYLALFNNTTGHDNTANGYDALAFNTTGFENTANGLQALYSNTTGNSNTANGFEALYSNTTGGFNVANGLEALYSNTTAFSNTANGVSALYSNTTGSDNTANGSQALAGNISGNYNTGIGETAGALITGSGNVCIGQGIEGVAGVDNTTWIRNVYASVASGRAVYVDSDNKIGTLSSSRRYKDEIRPIAKASEAILSLRPVSFRYKKEVDPTRSLSFGLIAEEVAKVDTDLVTPDRNGKPETVRYEAVNAMLLNEFLKEHRKVEEQQATITELKSTVAQQQKDFQATAVRQQEQIEALTAGLQKVSAQLAAASPSRGGLEVSKFAIGRIRRGGPPAQTVVNNH